VHTRRFVPGALDDVHRMLNELRWWEEHLK
jgi:hypothetical protein